MSRCSELPDAGLPGLVQLKLRSPHEVRATFWSEIKLLVILGVFFFLLGVFFRLTYPSVAYSWAVYVSAQLLPLQQRGLRDGQLGV